MNTSVADRARDKIGQLAGQGLDLPTFWHRVPRVEANVEKSRLELREIHRARPEQRPGRRTGPILPRAACAHGAPGSSASSFPT